MPERSENTVAYDEVLVAAIAAIGNAEGEIECPKCKGTGESDVSLSYDPELERPHFPECDRCDGTGSLDLTTSEIAAAALAAGLPLLGGMLPRRDEHGGLLADLKHLREARVRLEGQVDALRTDLTAAQDAGDNWWTAAQALRGAVVEHHATHGVYSAADEKLWAAARAAWQWPSMGDEAFDRAYPADGGSS